MLKSIFMAGFLILSGCVFAQRFTVSGVVKKSDSNQALPGTTVQLKGENKFSITNEFGQFELSNVAAGEHTLVFSFIGFETKEESVVVNENLNMSVALATTTQLTEEVVVYATRANEKTPIAYTNVSNQALQKQNFGQDLPFLLNWTPSLVTTSDAGAGVGYTGLRIRGSDATRINVTINGIPYNDAESQGTFWVNIPDIASSTESIQVQRGVGTSSNGAGSFGGTVNLQTLNAQRSPYAELTAGVGSFNTQRYTLKGGTGLLKNRWSFDARLSKITSDGYIDRATSDLKSYYVSGGYYGDKTIVKAVAFGGGERTYQAWNGIDEETMKTNRTFNSAGAIYNDDWSEVVGYYENEVDDYKQDHYQLHLVQTLSPVWNANLSLHYTYGRGFFEQYKQDEPFSELGLDNIDQGGEEIEYGDVIVRRWLDNDFYGSTFSLNYDKEKTALTIGGAYNEYANARHFGQIIWAEYDQNVNTPHQYYDGESKKKDFNIYTKVNYELTERLNAFIDLQYRNVTYKTGGIDDNQIPYAFDDKFNFFNPKAGVSYQLTENHLFYASYARANREPNRTDYVDGEVKPESEQLDDFEAGWKQTSDALQLEANFYYMHYNNQLVLTGEVNDSGYPIRANVGKSYRTGIELSAMARLGKNCKWGINTTLSSNKNKDFLADETDLDKKKNTTIVLSPSIIAGSQLTYSFKAFHVTLLSKYVGEQFLDNTQNSSLKLADYLINDLRLGHSLSLKSVSFDVNILINNLMDVEYASNGYTWGPYPYYYPQAGRNFMAMLTIKI